MAEEYISRIESLNKGDFVRLLELIPQFQMNPDFGKMEKGDESTGNLPFYAPSELVSEFLKIIEEMGIIIDFDWIKWNEGVEILKNPDYDFQSLNKVTLCKLITAIVKNDRFTEGYLLSKFNDGSLLKIIQTFETKFE
ncbi:MAG: hypothetical protein KDK36_10265 [Leptospiraceae bacterium]|nr:hypothetical protein [Leptospiraceae bacterium]